MWTMKKLKKGIPRRSRRKYSCDMIPFRKNCTRKEKEKFLWEVKEDRAIRTKSSKALVVKEYECYEESF